MNKYSTSLAVLALSLTVNQTQAAFAFSGVSGPGTVSNNSLFVDKVFGHDFTVGSTSLHLDSLGFFDPSGTGLDWGVELGIYPFDSDGPGGATPVLLVSLSVAAGQTPDDTDGVHSYFDVPGGIILDANARYRLVATTGNGGGSLHNTVPGPAVTPTGVDPAITIDTTGDFFSNAAAGSSLTYPTLELGPNGYDSPLTSFEFTAIPEPSSSLLLGLCGGLFAMRRRRS